MVERSSKIAILDEAMLETAVQSLSARDQDLERIFRNFGYPPLWAREPGFPTLIHIILEQQVSLASARAAFLRLQEAVRPLTPLGFLKLDDLELKQIGFSRQKTRYGRELANAVLEDRLRLDKLHAMEDDAVRTELIKIKGIGRWTADIYLVMVLLRPDVWPQGDLALSTAVQEVKQLAQRPDNQQLEAISRAWHPWRAVAARLCWHDYLCRRRK